MDVAADKISMLESKLDSKDEAIHAQEFEVIDDDFAVAIDGDFAVAFQNSEHDNSLIDAVMKLVEERDSKRREEDEIKWHEWFKRDETKREEVEIMWHELRKRDEIKRVQDDLNLNKFMKIEAQKHKECEDMWIKRMELMNDNVAVLREAVTVRDACIANLRASAGQSPLASLAPSTKQCEDAPVAVNTGKPKKKR